MPATPEVSHSPQHAASRDEDLAPLVFFYGIGSARPDVTFIEASDLPPQERWLLAHEIDMTPRLRAGHGCAIALDVHAKARIGNYLVRASVLRRHTDNKPVEFGAIGIHLDLLPEAAQAQVIEGKIPFGAILEHFDVPHSSHPRGFFQIVVDQRLAELLGAVSGQTLYGRCNELRHANGRVLADVVEVLPRGEVPALTAGSDTSFDVIVIGGGPAGCTAATLLAQKGRRVLLLEKEKMPRYHIGESLMPFCWFTLEKLGVLEQMKQHDYIQKLSVQFVNMDGKQSRPFYFFQHNDHPSSYTWQVERAEFDHMLFQNARKKGVDCREETKVEQLVQDENGAVQGVVARTRAGTSQTFHAPLTIDCSGRDAFWITKNQCRVRDPDLRKIAIWTYYKNAKRDEGLDAGSTTVAYIPEKGWFWYIPLKNGITSVGVVHERDYLFRDTRDPATIMAREIENNAWIKDHLSVGEQFGEYWVTGEYSYRSKYCAADGIVLAGDAFVFLDPVFSSGIFLALKSGESVADAVDAALTAKRYTADQFEDYGTMLCQHVETMRKIVYAFYDENFSFGKLVKANPDLRGRLTDCLIGDVSQDFDELFTAVNQIAPLPEPLDYGMQGKVWHALETAAS